MHKIVLILLILTTNVFLTNLKAQCIEGNCTTGNGIYIYKNASKYTGSFLKGMPNGIGVFQSSNGDKYQGEWKLGAREGKGKIKFKNNNSFEGIFLSNQMITGTMTYSNGDKYIGIWKSYKPNGIGKYIFANSDIYNGEFVMGAIEGKGTMAYADGHKFVGEWKNNKKEGNGITYTAEGKIKDQAYWKDGVPQYENVAEEDLLKPDLTQTEVYAVIIGVSRYTSMPTLRYSDDDAYRLYAFLKSPEGGALPDSHIKVLIDEDASKYNILTALNEVYKKADENDEIIFYFSGHGVNGGFLPSDFDGTNNILNHQELKNIIMKSKAKYKLCIADACHSGNLLAAKSAEKISKKYYDALTDIKGGYALLMSSKGVEFSLEDGGLRSGIFSHFLIKGLGGAADLDSNKIVTVQELYNYIKLNVTEYSGGVQNPDISGDYAENMPISIVR
jgi:hypothetical protein